MKTVPMNTVGFDVYVKDSRVPLVVAANTVEASGPWLMFYKVQGVVRGIVAVYSADVVTRVERIERDA